MLITCSGDGATSGGWDWAMRWEKTSFRRTGLSKGTGGGEGRGLFRKAAVLVGVGSSVGFRSIKGDDNRDGGAD